MSTLKKEDDIEFVNTEPLKALNPADVTVAIHKIDEAEVDEMWSYVGNKKQQRWLWHAINHRTGMVFAHVFGRRKDEVFIQLERY